MMELATAVAFVCLGFVFSLLSFAVVLLPFVKDRMSDGLAVIHREQLDRARETSWCQGYETGLKDGRRDGASQP